MLDNNQYDAIFTTDLATIGIRLDGSKLVKVAYLKGRKNIKPGTAAAQTMQNKIEKYLKPQSKLKTLKIAVQLKVTPFQKKVLEQLLQIPYGETRTYGEIAKILKTSPRAVGNACRRNPVPIIIPCHRVLAVSGLGGYDGATSGKLLNIKSHLLELESAR